MCASTKMGAALGGLCTTGGPESSERTMAAISSLIVGSSEVLRALLYVL